MSKEVSITVGRTARQFSGVKKLYTRNVGSSYSGGHTSWVPEDEVRLKTKNITANGTYRAEDDGDYGWSQVTVNVTADPGAPGSKVVGTDPADEEEYAVVVNEDGELEKTRLPTSIAVTRPPNNTSYENGDTVDVTGIIVHGYYADGSDYGAIQNSELRFGSLTAVYNENTQPASSGGGINAIRLELVENNGRYICPTCIGVAPNGYDAFIGALNPAVYYGTSYNGEAYFLRASGTATDFRQYVMREDGKYFNRATTSMNITVDNEFVHGPWGDVFTLLPVSTVNPLGRGLPNGSASGAQSIPVYWDRIIDGKTLETSFGITVSSHSHESGTF